MGRIVVATVPTVYGIETAIDLVTALLSSFVATVPTVYGIETRTNSPLASVTSLLSCNSTYRLRY